MIGELFDPKASFSIRETCKPHWSQAGVIVFITFRTADSISSDVLKRWDRERCDWLHRLGLLGGSDSNWRGVIDKLTAQQRQQFNRHFNRMREMHLDECWGACVLQKPKLSQKVADSLMYFDNERYRMGDFVVMPNHVHLLAAFPTEEAMEKQCVSWMHYTAHEINLAMGSSGHFWDGDPFDHLVRSPEQYDYLRRYVLDNPTKARLKAGEYHYRRCPD